MATAQPSTTPTAPGATPQIQQQAPAQVDPCATTTTPTSTTTTTTTPPATTTATTTPAACTTVPAAPSSTSATTAPAAPAAPATTQGTAPSTTAPSAAPAAPTSEPELAPAQLPADPAPVEPVAPTDPELSSKTAEPDPDYTPTEDPNATVVPGQMRSDREEIPAPFTKEDADKAETLEARSRISRAVQSCQYYWPSPHAVCGAIRDKYNSLGGPGSFLSYPNSPEYTNPDGYGKRTQFLNGPIYWSPAGGAHPVVNSFLYRWGVHGYETGFLRYPLTDEIVHSNGQGRHQEFEGGAIYVAFQNAVGASIGGAIRDKWNSAGGYDGPLGYPSSDEIAVNKNNGRYNNFVNGTVTWSQPTGARLLFGAIRDAWARDGREDGAHGYPLADEEASPDGVAQFARFEDGGSIYSTLLTGAWYIPANLLPTWLKDVEGGGILGYPTGPAHNFADALAGEPNVAQNFQGGSVSKSSDENSFVFAFESNAPTEPWGDPESQSANAALKPAQEMRRAENDEDDPYDTSFVINAGANSQYSYMPLRTGYWSGSDGWGYDKAYHFHNLKTAEGIRYVMSSPRSNRDDRTNGVPGDVYSGRAKWYTNCEPGEVPSQPATGSCALKATNWVYVVYDYRDFPEYKYVTGGNPLGVVTAFCGGGTECPNWVSPSLRAAARTGGS